MLTLSYGYFKPQSSDTGDSFFPAEEANWQKVNDHTHDGANSAPLATKTLSAPSGAWVSQGGGQYNQLLTLAAGFTYDNASIWVKTTAGEQVYLKLTRASATTFYIWTSDNTANYTVYYR